MWDGQWTKWEVTQFEESLEAKQEMEKDEWKFWNKTDKEFEKWTSHFCFGLVTMKRRSFQLEHDIGSRKFQLEHDIGHNRVQYLQLFPLFPSTSQDAKL